MLKKVGRVLIICEDDARTKQLKLSLGTQIDKHIVTSGRKGIDWLKKPSVSAVFIPLDLTDMDCLDFVHFAKRTSPDTLYFIISTPSSPDLSFLVASKEIDGFVPEPLSVSKILMILFASRRKKAKYKESIYGNLALNGAR